MRMPSDAARKSLEQKVQKFQQNLAESPGGAPYSYLTDRGITPESILQFRLGFDGERLVIPYLSPTGIWHYKRRCIQDHDHKEAKCPKYLYDEQGRHHHLYNSSVLIDADRVVLVEGEMDVIAASQLGLAAVGYPGVQSWSTRISTNEHDRSTYGHSWRWCFDSAEEVVVVADGDDPGRKAAGFVSEQLRAALTGEVRLVEMPDGEDTASFVAGYGELEYLDRLELL